MRQTVQLFKIWNIPVGVNNSWYLIFFLLTWSLATGYMPTAYPDLTTAQYWVLALLTSVFFFGSVIFHELAHAYFALRYHIGVRRITLFIFGGVAEMADEPKSPWSEFVIALAGPLASLLAAGIFFLLYQLDQQIPWLAAPTEYLLRINLLLAGFNMIPGFPLDGGRIFRAIVWHFTDYRRATKAAAFTGQLMAYGFMGYGIFQMVGGEFFDGLWLIFIGWFLYNSATAYSTEVNMRQALAQVTVEQVMQQEWQEIESNLPVSRLVDELIVRGGPRYYFVRHSGYGYEASAHPDGMLTMTDVSALGRDKWRLTAAAQLMVAWPELITTEPTVPLLQALREMDEHHVNQLPVLRDGALVGVLTRENVLHYIRMQAELT
ncbi:MAG: site-2 protease family protein [Ardenticatenaceae bacterium]|nr:site-2 protease family protein [Ardenticatenaceae bacterium]